MPDPSQSVARGACPVCGANVAVRKDGSLRAHQNRSAAPSRSVSGAKVYPHCHGTDQISAQGTPMTDHLALSVIVLREQGPMSLRDLTAETAQRMGWSLMYDDVFGVLAAAQQRGEVRSIDDPDDYRNQRWEATK